MFGMLPAGFGFRKLLGNPAGNSQVNPGDNTVRFGDH